MARVTLQDGTVLMPTTVILPEMLVEKAVRLKINRAALFRETLSRECERIETEEQGIAAANRDAPCSAPVRRRLELDHTSG